MMSTGNSSLKLDVCRTLSGSTLKLKYAAMEPTASAKAMPVYNSALPSICVMEPIPKPNTMP